MRNQPIKNVLAAEPGKRSKSGAAPPARPFKPPAPQQPTTAALLQRQKLFGNRETTRWVHSLRPTPHPTFHPSPQTGAPIQRMEDPDESIWKKFRDCAYAAGFNKFYAPQNVIQEIIENAPDEKTAWNRWIAFLTTEEHKINANVYKSNKAIITDMEKKKKEIEELDKKIELEVKGVPEKKESWDDMEMEDVPGDIKPWMQSPTRVDEYKDKLEVSYDLIQQLSQEAMDELHTESGLLEKGTGGAKGLVPSKKGEELQKQLLKYSVDKKPLPVSKGETDFLLSTFAPPKTGSISFQWRPEQLPLKLNFQTSKEPISTNIIPGVGTYTEHLLKMQEQHTETGIPKETPVHYSTLGGKKDERMAEMEKKIAESPQGKTMSKKEITELANKIILEEDKTMNLQLLEQARNHQDILATSLAYEGGGKLWPISQGLGKTMNPMYASGATSAVNDERRTGRRNKIRKESVEIAKKTLLEAIRRSKDPRYEGSFKSRKWLFHSIKSLRALLKKSDDLALRILYKEAVKSYFGKKKKDK